jgi:hypothetical protein
MNAVFIIIPIVATLLWLLCIRPYSRRNGKTYTPVGSIGVTFWVDWQQAREIAKANGDEGMIMICRVVFWLHVLFLAALAYIIFNSDPN